MATKFANATECQDYVNEDTSIDSDLIDLQCHLSCIPDCTELSEIKVNAIEALKTVDSMRSELMTLLKRLG